MPSRLHLPPNKYASSGPDAIELATETAGVELDPWQAWCLQEGLAERIDGKWCAFEAAIVCPRQTGNGVGDLPAQRLRRPHQAIKKMCLGVVRDHVGRAATFDHADIKGTRAEFGVAGQLHGPQAIERGQ